MGDPRAPEDRPYRLSVADRALHRQGARLLDVPPDRALPMAERTVAVPVDIPGAKLAHVGDKCSFDAFLSYTI